MKDPNLASGIEYDKKYPYPDEGTLILFNKADELKKMRELKHYTSIFNVSQVFYSIKEFLNTDFSQHKTTIEEYFSKNLFQEVDFSLPSNFIHTLIITN